MSEEKLSEGINTQPLEVPERSLTEDIKLVMGDVECKSADWYIGKFSNIATCANAVKAAGGKFFIFGKGYVKSGWCYREWTRARTCPEGWERDSYDFFEIASIRPDDVLQCEIDVMTATVSQSSGLLTKENYRDEIVTLANAQGEVRNWAWRRYSCAWEHKMSCQGGSAEIKTYEACCSLGWWSSSCSIPTNKKEKSTSVLSGRNDQWQQCQEEGHRSFAANPPSDPRLPQTGLEEKPCLAVSVAATTQTLRAKYNSCPSWLNVVLNGFAQSNKQSYELYYQYIPQGARNHPIAWLFGKAPESSLLAPSVFDTYTIGMVVAVIHLQLRTLEGRLKQASESVGQPHKQDFLDRLYVNDFRGAAEPEIDAPPSNSMVDAVWELGQVCIMDTFREMQVEDGIVSNKNSWEGLLATDKASPVHCPNGKLTCTKKEFILGVFADYVTKDGDPTYPTQQIDFRGNFYQNNLWDDAAEKLLAFQHLAMHRTRAVPKGQAPDLDGQSAAFVVSTSSLGGLKVRPGFAKLGADMFFSSAQEPIMIRTPDGQDIWRSKATSKTWQYWKFVWRSSMFLFVTLVDHLWMTHYAAGNALAAASREGLPPAHPLRRLLAMSTHGTIAVNSQALHQLIGPDHLLQRSTPFQDFHEIAHAAHAAIPSMEDAFGAFVDDSIFQALDPTLQEMPFYQDGRLIFTSIADMVDKWADLHSNEWCGADGEIKDADIKFFMKRLQTWSLFDRTVVSDHAWLGLYSESGDLLCKGFYKWLKTMLFAVSGYHRQVGTVADIASDPDFASFSNVDGEAFGRPRQHLQMALIAGSTAKIMPKVVSDYSFLAAGLGHEGKAAQIFKEFQADMQERAKEVDMRNGKRATPYLQMHPRFVESSVAV